MPTQRAFKRAISKSLLAPRNAEGTPIPPPPAPAAGASVWGPGFAVGTKDNLWIGGSTSNQLAHKFKAPASGNIDKVVWQPRWGSGYSSAAGTTPTIKIAIQEDSAGSPSGVDLGSGSVTFGALTTGNGGHLRTTLTSAATVTSGAWYWVVYTNTSATPTTVYLSSNHSNPYNNIRGGFTPVCPAYPDGEWSVKYKQGAGSWTNATTGTQVVANFRAAIELHYSSGTKFGQPFLSGGGDIAGRAGGSYRFRERIIVPAGGDVSVTAFHFRVSKSQGVTDALTVTLQNSAGTTIDTGTVAAASVADHSGADSGGGNPRYTDPVSGPNDCGDWETLTLGATRTLTSGAIYYLLFTATTGPYWTVPMRNYEFHNPDPPIAGMDFYHPDGTLGTSGYSRLEKSSDGGTTWNPSYAYGVTLPQMSWYADLAA